MDYLAIGGGTSSSITLVPDKDGNFSSASGALQVSVVPSHPGAVFQLLSGVTKVGVVVTHPDGTTVTLPPADAGEYLGSFSLQGVGDGSTTLPWRFAPPGLIDPGEHAVLTYAVEVDESSTATVTADDGSQQEVTDWATATANVVVSLEYPPTVLTLSEHDETQTISAAPDSTGKVTAGSQGGVLHFTDSNLSVHPSAYIVAQTVTVTRADGSQASLSADDIALLEEGFLIWLDASNSGQGAFDWKYDPNDVLSAPVGRDGQAVPGLVRGGHPAAARGFLVSDWPRTGPTVPASPPPDPDGGIPTGTPTSIPLPGSPTTPTVPSLPIPPVGTTPGSSPQIPGTTPGSSPQSPGSGPINGTPPSQPTLPGGTPPVGSPPTLPTETPPPPPSSPPPQVPLDVLRPGETAVIRTTVQIQDGYYLGKDSATVTVTLASKAVPLFTPKADRIDFNDLAPAQQEAIVGRADIYHGLGGDDWVWLPTQSNWDEALGGGKKLGWTGSAASTFYTGSKPGDKYSVVAGKSVALGDRINSDKGSYFIQGGSGTDTITIVSDGDNTVTGGSGTEEISIQGSGNNTVRGGSGTNDISVEGTGHADISIEAGGENAVDLSFKAALSPAHPDEIKVAPAAHLTLVGPVQNAHLDIGNGAKVTVKDFVGKPSEISFDLIAQQALLSNFAGGNVQEVTGLHTVFQTNASGQNVIVLPGSPADYAITVTFKQGDSLADTHTITGKLTSAVLGPPTTPTLPPVIPGNPNPPNTPPIPPTLPSTPGHVGVAPLIAGTSAPPAPVFAVIDTVDIERVQFQTNTFEKVNLTDNNLTVEMLELASEGVRVAI